MIVPIFNVEEYIAECLDSLVHQTLSEIEIIAVNDGSTDSSGDIVNQYAEKYPNKIKAVHKSNGGLSDARNTGIEKSGGEFIGFVDGDDWVEKSMFQKLYEKAISSQSDIVVCAFNRRYSDPKKQDKPSHNRGRIRGVYADFDKSVTENPRLLYASHAYACTKIYKRRLFANGRHRFPIRQWFEDSATVYNLMLDANKISCVFEQLYNYRIRTSGSITSSLTPKIFDIFKSCDAVISYYSKNSDMSSDLRLILERIIEGHITRRFDLVVTGTDAKQKILALKYVREAFSYLDSQFPGWSKNQNIGRRKRIKFLAYLFVLYPSHLKFLRRRLDQQIARRRINRRKKSKTEALQNYGYEVLSNINKTLNAHSIDHFVDFGTLLGFVREGAFLSHDLDLDIGLFADENRKEKISEIMKNEGYSLWRTYRYKNKIVEQSYIAHRDKGSIKFDFNYYETIENKSKTYLFYQDPCIQYPDEGMRSIVEMSYSRIDAIKSILVKDLTVPIPENAEKLLEEKYGKDWKVPNKNWIYWKSPSASPIQDISHFEAN